MSTVEDIAALHARVDERVEQVAIGYGETALARALHNVLDLVAQAHAARTLGLTGLRVRDAIREGLEA